MKKLAAEEARKVSWSSTPTFDIAVEMMERQSWVVHEQVAETVDSLLRAST